MSNSLRPWTGPVRLLCPWDSPGKNTGEGCHVLLQGIFPAQRFCTHLLHWRADSLPSEPLGKALDYLEYLIQCKFYVNSCKYNVNTMGIVARVWQIEVLLLELSGIFFFFSPWIFSSQLVESLDAEPMDPEGQLYIVFSVLGNHCSTFSYVPQLTLFCVFNLVQMWFPLKKVSALIPFTF